MSGLPKRVGELDTTGRGGLDEAAMDKVQKEKKRDGSWGSAAGGVAGIQFHLRGDPVAGGL